MEYLCLKGHEKMLLNVLITCYPETYTGRSSLTTLSVTLCTPRQSGHTVSQLGIPVGSQLVLIKY